MVQLATDGRISGTVVTVGLLDERDPSVHLLVDVLLVDLVLLQDALRTRLLYGDPGLFLLEDVHGDGVGVVGLERLARLLVQPFELTLSFLGSVVVGRQYGRDVVAHQLADLFGMLPGQGDRPPVLFNEVFSQIDGYGALVAAVLQALSAAAVEVVVELALPVA